MSSDSSKTTATETVFIRKWASPQAQADDALPHEIIRLTQVTVQDGDAIQEQPPEIEVATDAARIAALNPLAVAAEQRAQRKGDAEWD